MCKLLLDLTDEDDKIGRASLGLGNTVKLVNKPTTTTSTASPNNKVGNMVNKTNSKTITHQVSV